MHVYVFSHVCKKTVLYSYTYIHIYSYTYIHNGCLHLYDQYHCLNASLKQTDQSRMEVAKAFKLYTLNVANLITLLNEIQYTTRDACRIDP